MHSPPHILLIEDEPDLRALYERVLTGANLHVTTAIDGQEGLIKAADMPDLILLDIMMPKLTGIDVLKKLKSDEKTKNLAIVLLTNLGQESVIKQALEIGARGYLMKMRLSPYDLIERVKEFLADPTLKTDVASLNLER